MKAALPTVLFIYAAKNGLLETLFHCVILQYRVTVVI